MDKSFSKGDLFERNVTLTMCLLCRKSLLTIGNHFSRRCINHVCHGQNLIFGFWQFVVIPYSHIVTMGYNGYINPELNGLMTILRYGSAQF